MNNITALILLMMMLKVGLSQHILKTGSEVKDTLNFLQQGDKRIKTSKGKDIIYIVGPTRTGKSTLTYFLAGNPSYLESQEVDQGSDDYIIEHIANENIGNKTLNSETIYPDLIVNENNVPYYDCPGFSDTRKTNIEVVTTYFTKKVISYAERLKIVFVVNYQSMIKGITSKNDFPEFVKHATEFIKNVKPYSDGILLIASKVPSHYGGDRRLINVIRSSLKECRRSLFEEAQRNSSQSILNELELLDIFLINGRIDLFKLPTRPGLLSEIPEIMENRAKLLDSIDRKIKFVERHDDDFGYALSARSKLEIDALPEEINRSITNIFVEISDQVIDYYSSKSRNNNDMENVKSELEDAIKVLSKISDDVIMSEYLTAVNQLSIPGLQAKVSDIKNHLDYMQFLQKLHDKPLKRRVSDWTQALQSCLEFLIAERNWYSLAHSMFHRLSEFDVQRNTSIYDVKNVERWGLGDRKTSEGIFITHDNFNIFLKKSIGSNLVENIQASQSKIDLLNKILFTTLKSKPTFTCQDDKLTVKGIFVKFSDLEEVTCPKNVRLIEVFGLSTIFIDKDFKKNVDLVVIAPKWHVENTQTRINLDGPSGLGGGSNVFHTKLWIDNNVNGRPGMPGENANNFFGYGEDFVNKENLYISAVGGDGGPGENGKDGIDGQESGIPFKITGVESLNNVDLIHTVNTEDTGFLYFNRKYWVDEVYHSYPYCPVINGIGGSGGFGGFNGTIELNGILGINMFTKNGERGFPGRPGRCGEMDKTIEIHKSTFKSCKFWFFCSKEVTWIPGRKFIDERKCPNNCHDSPYLVNDIGISKPTAVKRPNVALSVDRYKSFVRENMHTLPMMGKRLASFLNSIEQNSKIRAIYDSKAFIDDFFQVQDQLQTKFYVMGKENIFLESYKSLLQRILEYANNRSDLGSGGLPVNERRVLATLYTASLSEICKMRSGTEQNLIIDIESYLDVAIDHIKRLKESGKQVAINRFKDEYRRYLEVKIIDNHDFIVTDIMTEIERLNKEIDLDVENLLNNVLEAKNSVSKDINRYNEAKEELEKSLDSRGLFIFLKVITGIASFFDGFAMVKKTFDTAVQIKDVLAMDHYHRKPSDKIFYTPKNEFLQDNFDQFKNSALLAKERKSGHLLNILNTVQMIATQFSFKDILEPITKTRQILNGDKNVDLSSDEIDSLNENIQNVMLNKTNEVKRRNETSSLNALEIINKKLSMLQMDVDIFSKFSSDEQKLHEMEAAMKQSQVELMKLKDFERNFRGMVEPILRQMLKLVNRIPNVSTETIPSEKIKWYFQTTLNDLRLKMRRAGDGSKIKFETNLLATFEKLDAAVSTLINIYDRLQIYEDQVKLSSYIANIESADQSLGMTPSNPDLDHLNFAIQSNVLLTIFDNAVNGFKQTIFPFADFYLRRFQLPSQLNGDNKLETVVKEAIEDLVNLRLTLKEYRSSINENDNLIHTADFTSALKSSQPFYVWTGNDYHETIAQLLSGTPITLKADITKGSELNAVKFQYLEINLKSSNQSHQAKLNKFLDNFDVTIVHHGNSYYRCDNKFYLITSPIQRIQYSFEKDSKGLPIRRNNVYDKMRHGDFTLSPYALLTMSLNARKPNDFMLLNAEFSRNVNLELIGRGQYVNPNVDACKSLEKYYVADEMLNDLHEKENLIK